MDEEIKQEETQDSTVAEEQKAETSEEEKPLEKMTAKELREVALGIPGITGVHAMKKEELLAAIKEARGIADEEPKKKKKTKSTKEIDVRLLKKKISSLREEKRALPSSSRKERDILRRRINRLKKQTRKAV